MEESGRIDMGNGFKFFWTLSNGTHPEISGGVERANGTFVKGCSGWYRTADPQEALKSATARLADCHGCRSCKALVENLHAFENAQVCAPCFKTLSETHGYAEPNEGWPTT